MTNEIKALLPIDYLLYYGTFIDTPQLGQLQVRFNRIVGVDNQGKIDFIDDNYDGDITSEAIIDYYKKCTKQNPENIQVSLETSSTKFFIPGFIDTHIHASQFPNVGIGLGIPLLDWLKKYTFPMENQLNSENLDLVFHVYNEVISKTLKNGTTYASYYTNIDPVSTNIFTDLLLKLGQRGSVGKVCMNDNPEYKSYEEDFNTCKQSTTKVVDYIKNIDQQGNMLVQPILTPRFAPVCTGELLQFLGDFANENNLPIQTHISENLQEIELVKTIFPNCKNYAEIYNQFNLLNDNTILAHAVYLNDSECKLIKQKNCSISHCPTSNTFISSGEAPIKKYLYQDKINVSLGTDLSGGFESSILGIIKHSILVSHHIAMKSNNMDDRLTIKEGIYMATQAGAIAVGLGQEIGTFEIGKKFDCQLINLATPQSNISIFDWQLPKDNDSQDVKVSKLTDLLGKWVFNGDDRNCTKVWCNGRLVVQKC